MKTINCAIVFLEQINCHDALAVGIVAMKVLIGKNFNESYWRNEVIPLLEVNSKMKNGDKIVAVDLLWLFQIICLEKKV